MPSHRHTALRVTMSEDISRNLRKTLGSSPHLLALFFPLRWSHRCSHLPSCL